MTLLALVLVLAQPKDNLDYKHWSGCAPGSWVKLVMDSSPGGKRVVQEVVLRLIRTTAEQAVVEKQVRTTTDGRTVPQAPFLESIPAKKDRADEVLREGEEEIEAGGRRLRCKVLEFEKTAGGEQTRVKLWVSDQVPGGAVRMEVRKPGADAPDLSVRAEGWEKK